MKTKKYYIALAIVVLLLLAAGITYRWTDTPYGRLDYRAAFSLHLLSFEKAIQPHPGSSYEITVPINLIYGLSSLVPKEDVRKVEDIVIQGDGLSIPARVYWPDTPANAGAPLPVIVYFHGGGFVLGSVDIFDPLARSLSNAAKAIVVSVDYRLAPENPYPDAVNDAYTAVKWVSQNAATLGADASLLVVAGDSAGGNLAAVTALKARDENGPAIAGQILYYPGTDLTDTHYASDENFTDGFGLSSQSMDAFLTAYVGHVDNKSDPYISPMHAASLANLPPALIVTAGFDPLTDSATEYADKLRRSDVLVTQVQYPSMIHGFMSVSLFSQRRKALIKTSEFFDELMSSRELH